MINVTFRMDKGDKQEFERVINAIGLNLSSAFNIFAKAVIRENAIPFALKIEKNEIPNDETIAAMERVKNGEDLETFTIEDLKRERAAGLF